MDTAIRHRVNAARAAIRDKVGFFKSQFGDVSSQWKEDDTRVTFADFAISEKIGNELTRAFPEDQFCSEESNPADEVLTLDNRYTWILDPIDGTNNYALGIPFCAISLALLKKGVPVYGLIYDFSQDLIIEGGGGYPLLKNKIKKAPPENKSFDPKFSVFGFHFPVPADKWKSMEPLLTNYRVRSLGSAALNFAYVSLGLMDGAIDFKVKVWDIAGVYAILQSAGRPMSFLEDTNPFPISEFHVESPRLRCFAGSPDFVESVNSAFGIKAE